jgi:hypothetical protein
MKSPPVQHPDEVARQLVEDFINEIPGSPKEANTPALPQERVNGHKIESTHE